MSDPHLQRLVRIMNEEIPFNRLLGITVAAIERGRATLRLPFQEAFIGDGSRPAMHGGVLSALIDTAGGSAAWSALEAGQWVSTVDLLVDYLLPGPSVDLLAHAEVVHRGQRICRAHVVVTRADDPDGAPIATGRAVYNIVGPVPGREPAG